VNHTRQQYLALLIRGMFAPVRCTCGHVYDLAEVEIIARHTDCSVWRCPGCRRQVDDRGDSGWKPFKDYTRLNKDDLGPHLDMLGRAMWP
jgi:hypothetical protein